MQNKVLTLFGTLLISALAVQMAAASEHNTRFRKAYNQVSGPTVVTPTIRYNWDTFGYGLGGRDPSRVGGSDADLRPSGS